MSVRAFPFNCWPYEFLKWPKMILDFACVLRIVQNVYTLRARLQIPFCGFVVTCAYLTGMFQFAGANFHACPLSGRVCRGSGF